MPRLADDFLRRIASLRVRIRSLAALKRTLVLPAQRVLPRQWEILQAQLVTAVGRLQGRVGRAARTYLPRLDERSARRKLTAILGEVELDLTNAYCFFDTYMDVLSQRLAPELGTLLAGCDRIAWDAIRRDHPALMVVEPPLVYCDRGFGASVIREGVRFPDRTPNPMPLVQIPYSRLREKYNLTSIVHEVGHEAMVRLGLTATLPKALHEALSQAGAPRPIADFFALWVKELGPDFWTFSACGHAQTAAVRDILALPQPDVLRLSPTDPHPPPYLRVLQSIAWCRSAFGMGPWDEWERRFIDVYDLQSATPAVRDVLEAAVRYLPLSAHVFFTTRFRALGGRTIPDLFDLPSLAPARLRPFAMRYDVGAPPELPLSIAGRLALFRIIRDERNVSEESIDQLMTHWLQGLAQEPI